MSSAVAVYGSGDGDEASSDIVDSEDLGMGCRRRRLSQSDVEPRQLRTAPVNRGALNPGSLAQPPQQDSGHRLSIATPTSVGLRGKALGQDLASGPREDSDWANSPGVGVLFATHTVATGRIGVPPLPAGQALAQGLGPRANRRGVCYQKHESCCQGHGIGWCTAIEGTKHKWQAKWLTSRCLPRKSTPTRNVKKQGEGDSHPTWVAFAFARF